MEKGFVYPQCEAGQWVRQVGEPLENEVLCLWNETIG